VFLLPGLVIAHYIADAPLSVAQSGEIIRYLRSKQNGDGGFGLHIEG
jgi:lanosterol synthase